MTQEGAKTDGPGTLEIGLLGPVRVLRAGAPVDIGGTRGATLLAMLALQAGAPVSSDILIDELWAGEPPDGASTTLRSYVSRLRTALGDAAPIERLPTGYSLQVPREWIDAVRFEAGVREGRLLLERGRSRRAADVLRAALALWRGAPFTGLPSDGAFRAESVRLEEIRLNALESRLEADLDAGRSAELVDELETLLAEHPFRERLWRHLMLGLYRAGRQADALAAYHRARVALDEQLGIEPGEDLRALEAKILRQDVPEPAARRRPIIAVPSHLTTFIGRDAEVEDVLELLGRTRFVTLVGVGGVGKTRLAVETARRAGDVLVDGVAFVDLAALADPAHLPAHVASSLDLPEKHGRELPAALAEQIGSTDFLLVLDNCEHLRAEAATLALSLLATSPELRVLATSREALDVAGEATYRVPPLALPSAADGPDAARESDAVRLLLDRATLMRHDLRVDDEAYATAARICRELDGLPLAIELAAARAKALSLEEIAVRLQDRFRFLVSWRRLSAARHRTLREAMDWSFELLADDEQRLLTRLSVFPAGATLASVAAVCLDGDEDEAERLIERLVDASLVMPLAGPSATRYRLLETVRQYAAEHVPEADLPELQRRHAQHIRAVAESTNLSLESPSHASRYDMARDELPSIRAAIQWAGRNEPILGIAIACALERFWAATRPGEGIAIFDALLAHEAIPDGDRARALRCRGGSRYSSGDFAGGVEDYQQALAIHRRLGHNAHQAHILMRLSAEANRVGSPADARRLLDEAAAIGGSERFAPDRYVSLGMESDLAFLEGREDDAFELLRRTLRLAEEAGDPMWQLDSLEHFAERALERGRLEEAGPPAREALVLARAIGGRPAIVWCLSILARLAAGTGAARRAGRIWGGLEAEVERGGRVGQWEFEAEAIRAQVAALVGRAAGTGQSGDDAFDRGVVEGKGLSLDEVVTEAIRPR